MDIIDFFVNLLSDPRGAIAGWIATLGAGAYVAAGTTLTRDLQPLDFCIGREREKVKPQGAAGRYKNG